MKKLRLAAMLVLIVPASLVAQENDSLKMRKAQVSFAYPIGSNGKDSKKYSNNVSFNILYGVNGGVHGFELGSILNYNKGKVQGLQLSGILNINTGHSSGVLLSGVSNVCMDSTAGLLLSGVLNYSKKNAGGFQLATANIAAKAFRGFQLGAFNYAQKLKGVQLGVINYLNDGEGALPIGVFSIVKNGHYEFELTGGEVLYTNLNYKMGVKKFYTIFKAGYSSFKDNPVYSVGLGFGSNIPLSEKQKISIDLSFNQIIYNNKWNDGNANFLTKADFNYKYAIAKKACLLIGPSYNVYVTKEKVNGEYGTLHIPYTIYTKEGSASKVFMWVGINAGLSYRL